MKARHVTGEVGDLRRTGFDQGFAPDDADRCRDILQILLALLGGDDDYRVARRLHLRLLRMCDLRHHERRPGGGQRQHGAERKSGLPHLTSPPMENFSGSRSEEHTSELQSLMRTSYAVF